MPPQSKTRMNLHVSQKAWLGLLHAVLVYVLAGSTPVHALGAAALKDRHAALREQLAGSPFQRPVYLESFQTDGQLKGDIYAQIEQPFDLIASPLQDVRHWCDILILHLNVKGCRAYSRPAGDVLSVSIGRKFDQPLADAHQIEFLYKVVAAEPDYLAIQLSAAQGPLGTSDYRIALEAVTVDARHSFIHMSYAYEHGTAARLAMQGYLATTGRNKVGFSITGRSADGNPVYIGGTRGVVERNTMRYYLAIEAYLGALSAPTAQQVERRLQAWHAGVESYPVQLRELSRAEYLDMKHKEIKRQRELTSLESDH